MPPLPTNGTSYPPSSSSGYQPLNLNDDDQYDLESSHASTSSQWVQRRTFTHSPYRAQANDPTHLLHTFLSDTRPHPARPKELHLRISVRYHNSRVESVELPLPELTTSDSLPYALADDVPCLRGLPSGGAVGWKDRLRGFLGQLRGESSSSARKEVALQVWNAAQSKPLYASAEEIERYHTRLQTTTLPPWTPLNDDFLPTSSAAESDNTEQQVDQLFTASDSLGDFDLSSVFRKPRHRKTTRLVSSGLQEAIERFANDRHFSKRLVTRQCVWGWNAEALEKEIRELVGVKRKGKGRAEDDAEDDAEDVKVDVEVVGLDQAPVYHVVWAPIAYLSNRCGWRFDSRAALLCLVGVSAALVAAVLLGALTNTLVIIVALLCVASWSTLMWLVQTQNECVYDGIGTAWPLAPRWAKLDADPSWDRDTVLQKLDGEGSRVTIEQRDEGWFVKKGLNAEEWLNLHRERLIHALKP